MFHVAQRFRRQFTLIGWVVLPSLLLGCRAERTAAPPEFEPNWVFARHMGQRSEQPMDQATREITTVLTEMFGTPDEPKLPSFISDDEDFKSLLSMDNLQAASGPADEEGRGLYRKHCASCHGVTGNGRGPTAALVNPYPRDYRLGRFKFKSTPIGTKPTKQDLADRIRHGLPGTSMVPIPELTDADVAALVDYVIYLSWRGQVEINLLIEAGELYFADGESIYDPRLKDSEDEEDREMFEEQLEIIQDYTMDVADDWLSAEDRIKEVPQRDASIVPDTTEELLAALEQNDSSIKDSVERGRLLFLSEKTSCSKCHGPEGRGDGTQKNYDDWTKEWTQKFGLDPEDLAAQVPYIARGALPVRLALARNFQSGVCRGGATPEDLFRRIALGIEGTPMPAAAVGEAEIWDLVNYIRSIYQPEPPVVDAVASSAD